MKKILALATAMILALGTCTTAFAADVDGAELLKTAVVHIDCEDSVDNLNGGDVTPEFKGTAAYTEGRFGKAASVSNGAGFIDVPYLVGKESFTVTTWLYMHEWDGDPAIISNKDWDSGSNPGFVLMPKADSFKLNANAVDSNRFDGAFATQRWIDDPTAMNTWVHLTLVVDRENSTFSFALNGGELKSHKMEYTTEIQDVENNYGIVFGNDGPGKYNEGQTFVADFDEIAIFDKALTQEEVEAVYTYAPEGSEPAKLGEGKAEAPADDTADDTAEAGNNSTAVVVVVAVVAVVVIALVASKNKKTKK